MREKARVFGNIKFIGELYKVCNCDLMQKVDNEVLACRFAGCGGGSLINAAGMSEKTQVNLVQFKIINFCMQNDLVNHVDAWRKDPEKKVQLDEKTLESACRLLQTTGKIIDQVRRSACEQIAQFFSLDESFDLSVCRTVIAL